MNDQVSQHYDAVAEEYQQHYQKSDLYTSPKYKANYIRLQHLLNSFAQKNIKRVIEVGVGEGTPLSTLGKSEVEVWGFDISQKMVDISKQKIQAIGQQPEQIFLADIEDPITYNHALAQGPFDGLMAMGVMPHVRNDEFVLNNMRTLVKPGGSVFIEFRNKLFSLFTFNRYTYEFILDDLLRDIDPELKKLFAPELEKHVNRNMPPQRLTEKDNAPGYDAITSKFHNPFEVEELFAKCGFSDIQLHWYHYHPVPPMYESLDKASFRQEALHLEHETSGWRGMFLCSAFVIEAVRAR